MFLDGHSFVKKKMNKIRINLPFIISSLQIPCPKYRQSLMTNFQLIITITSTTYLFNYLFIGESNSCCNNNNNHYYYYYYYCWSMNSRVTFG